MDRNWIRSGEKNYKQPLPQSQQPYQQPYQQPHQQHYRKKNDYSGQEFYNHDYKSIKQVAQVVKKESFNIALHEDELLNTNFSLLKNCLM
jgi:hypothetical protein